MMEATCSVTATCLSADHSTEVLTDVDSLFDGDSGYEISFSVPSVQDLSTSLETTPPLHVKQNRVAEVIMSPCPSWVNEHQLVVDLRKASAAASGSLVDTLSVAFSNNGVQPSPSPSPIKSISLAKPRNIKQSLEQTAFTLSPSLSLSSPSSPHSSHSIQQQSGAQKTGRRDDRVPLHQKGQPINNITAGRNIDRAYRTPPEVRGHQTSERGPKRGADSRTPHTVAVETTGGTENPPAESVHPTGTMVGSDILALVATLRHLAKAHKLATAEHQTWGEKAMAQTGAPEVERHRLEGTCSVAGERSSRLQSRPSQSTAAAFVDRLEDMFGPGSVMRGSGPRPSNKEPKDRSVGIVRLGRSDANTDSTVSDNPTRQRQDKVRAREQVAESGMPREPKRRRVEERSVGSQAEGVTPAKTISLESVGDWTRMLQKLIKGKSRLRQEELMGIRQLMDKLAESWLTKKLGLEVVKESGLLESIRHLGTLTANEIGYGDKHGLRGKAQALVALFSD